MALIARRRKPVVVSELAITAAAAPVPPEKWGNKIVSGPTRADWQEEAWVMVDLIGELRAAIEWKRALISRFRLVASDIDPKTGRPTGETSNTAARDIVQRIAGGINGQSQMLGRLSVLLQIPGEAFLAVIYPGDEEQWHVVSGEEIINRGSGRFLCLPDGTHYELNEDTDTLTRIWNQHPRRSWEADSALHAALPICREIVRMTQNIEAAGKSRQAGNGILVLPEEISMPSTQAPTTTPDPDAPALPPPPPAPIQYVTSADIQTAIQVVMGTAIKDPASAEALVPIVMQCKGEFIDKIRHITFGTDVTAQSTDTRDRAMRRLAMALDMPPEILLGAADLNHWNIYAIEAQAVRWYCADDMETICHALTDYLLKPMLKRTKGPRKVTEDSVVVWYSLQDADSDPKADANLEAAFDKGVITAEAYRLARAIQDRDAYPYTKEGWADWARDMARRNFLALEKVKMLIPEIKDVIPDAPAPGGAAGGATSLPPSDAKSHHKGDDKPTDVNRSKPAPKPTVGTEPPATQDSAQQ